MATATPKKLTTSLSHIRRKVQKMHGKVPPVDGNGRQVHREKRLGGGRDLQ
jgi:hypothetical protein